MSTKIYTAQKSRPYKVEVFGLQDDYIGTLQSFADLSIGRVQDPKVTLSGDGTQEFTCSIPRFYINPETNEKIINPRWEDIKNGVLAENTRVLKVFVIEEGETKVYPFIVDEIIDKRDSHFSVYKEITASGLAFAELGKIGLRLELNKDIVEADYKKDKNTVATLDYWLDKVFPNEKDENGAIIRWLTPWSYDIRMDWSNYNDAAQRETNKMYDDIQVDKWEVTDGKLVPAGTSKLQEKARYINSDRGSNKYNITQTIAETFGIFCIYEYKCETNGQFIKTYIDKNGRNMTGRTAVFYNRAIKTDNPFTLDYQKNLQSISRTCDSTEVYTKLFVDPIQSDTMTDGYVTIANTAANPLMDEFILNFDYLYSKGSITEYQKDFIDKYSVEIHEINEELRNKGELINLLTVEINDKKAEKAGAEKSVSAIQEELTHYQTLRDNDVTNTPVTKDKNNSYSVVFIKDKEKTYYTASIRLEGVLSGSINGYDTYEYKNIIFTSDNLVSSQDYKPVLETDPNMYVVLDEDGYAIGLYTSNAKWFETDDTENSYSLNAGYMIYLALQYSPHNKYVEVCNRFERMIVKKEETIMICDSIIKNKQTELDALIAQQTELLAEKDLLNQKLERIMGPALREGHWSVNEYEDIGRKTETTVKARNTAVDNVSLVFDTELFDGEEKGYYYASAEDASSDIRTYYDYIDISSYIASWKDKNPEDLVIHLIQPEFRYTVTESQANGLAAGNYFILFNMVKYYFILPQTLVKGNILRIQNSSEEAIPIVLQMSTDNGQNWTTIPLSKTVEEEITKQSANLTDIFEGLNKYLSTYKIYPNAGFVYSFAVINEKITPILLLNNPEINYSIYKNIGYSFGTEELINTTWQQQSQKEMTICYPRIVIAKNNVNHNDDLLTITEEGTEKALTKFEDYSVLLRQGWPYFNLKITKNTTPYALLNKNYTIVYRVFQANEMLYRDALEVARENSRPRFSYDVSVAQLPDTVESYELGQLGYINDSALGVKAAKGYISSITLVLDSPKDDEIQIQNYKTKFEDLFATITASSEAMKSNQQSYDIAASIINPSTGSIQGSILQDSFNNNRVELIYSNTQVHIDDTDGITLTNTEPYSNGVYGQVVIRGGGIYLSNQIDSNYERIWSTGITPNGINASMITTGQLDANLIRIFAGNNVAFQWNSEGIYAYKRDGNNQFLPNTYVRYSDKGLQYIDNGDTIVDLGWNGLAINSQDGAVSLTGKEGLVVYEGLPNADNNNHVVKLGRFGEENNYTYGLKLYKAENGNYVETLTTENNGQLWLKDYLTVGAEGAGISGVNNIDNPIRFWAGSNFTNRSTAPFRVLHDGSVYASKLIIGGSTGNMTASELINQVDGLQDSVDNLGTQAAQLSIRTISTAGQIYNSSEENPVTALFTEIYLGEIRLTEEQLDEQGYENRKLTYYKKGLSDTEWVSYSTPTEDINGAYQTANVKMEVGVQYKAELTYIYHGLSYEATSAPITFTMVSNGATGSAGSNAINYRLQLSATSVTKKLNGSFSPTTVTCSVNKIADTTTSNISISDFKLKVQKQVGNNKSEISTTQSSSNWTIALDSTMTDAESFVLTLTNSNGTIIYDTCSISCVISDELKELAAIDENEVYIAEGKVRANSIVANAIIADKIATDAVTADKIAANAVTADKIKANSITVGKVTNDFGKNLDISGNTRIGLYVNENGVDTTSVTLNSTGIVLKTETGGTFIVDSGNFSIDSSGNVTLTGKITAESGSIGGWNIDETSTLLYSGKGNKYVALSSDTNQIYSIWAGAEDPSKAAFAVTNEGHVYLEKVYVQTDIDENGDPIYAAKSLTEYPLWAIQPAYNGRIIEVTSSEKEGQVTLTFTRSQGDPLTVNFNKAAVNSQNYTILFGGSGVNLTAQLYKNGSTLEPINGVYSSASLVLEKDASGSYANGKVTVSTVNSAPNAPTASISVAEVYDSVTVSGSWDGAGKYTASTSNKKSVSTTIGVWGNRGTDGAFTVGAGESSARVSQVEAEGKLSIINSANARVAQVSIGEIMVAQKDLEEIYKQGWNDCVNSVGSGITCYTSADVLGPNTYYNDVGAREGYGYLLINGNKQVLYSKPKLLE